MLNAWKPASNLGDYCMRVSVAGSVPDAAHDVTPIGQAKSRRASSRKHRVLRRHNKAWRFRHGRRRPANASASLPRAQVAF